MAEFRKRPQYIELSAHPGAVGRARTHVRRVLDGWGRADLADVAVLVVSELVTNAIKAALGREPYPEQDGPGHPTADLIWLDLHRAGDLVVLEVWDPTRFPPVLKTPGDDDEGGRGIFLVDAVARSWGYRWPRTGGKVVWCSLEGWTKGGFPR